MVGEKFAPGDALLVCFLCPQAGKKMVKNVFSYGVWGRDTTKYHFYKSGRSSESDQHNACGLRFHFFTKPLGVGMAAVGPPSFLCLSFVFYFLVHASQGYDSVHIITVSHVLSTCECVCVCACVYCIFFFSSV